MLLIVVPRNSVAKVHLGFAASSHSQGLGDASWQL